MYKKIEIVPYNGTILISFFPTLESIYPLSTLNKGYTYNPESIYIDTINEQEIEFGDRGKVEVFCYVAENKNDYQNEALRLKEKFLCETILNNIDKTNTINIVGDITDIDPEDKDSTIILPKNRDFLQISIFKKDSKKFYVLFL